MVYLPAVRAGLSHTTRILILAADSSCLLSCLSGTCGKSAIFSLKPIQADIISGV